MAFQHQIRVRYSECDQQGVVFNAHYVSYMDDTTEVWVRSLGLDGVEDQQGWEWMVAHISVDWMSSARHGDILEIEVAVVHWGSTSFHFGFIGRIGEREVFRARSGCVTVDPSTYQKVPTPNHARRLLGNSVDWDVPA